MKHLTASLLPVSQFTPGVDDPSREDRWKICRAIHTMQDFPDARSGWRRPILAAPRVAPAGIRGAFVSARGCSANA